MNYSAQRVVEKLANKGFDELKVSEVHSAFIEIERDCDRYQREAVQSKAQLDANEKLIKFHEARVDTRTAIIVWLTILNAGFVVALILYLAKR